MLFENELGIFEYAFLSIQSFSQKKAKTFGR